MGKCVVKIYLLMAALSLLVFIVFSCKKNVLEEKNTITESIESNNDNIGKFTYDEIDLEPNYDSVAAITIDFDKNGIKDISDDLISEDNENVYIKSGGIYVLKGTLNNKTIQIVEGIGERVQIVLDGFKTETDKENVIYSNDKCKAQIFLADDSVNEIKLHRDVSSAKSAKDASVIYSKESIVFNGNGKLILDSDFECSVQSADSVTFIRGNYEFNTKGDAIKVKKDAIFRSGYINIVSGDDAIKSTSDKNGCIYVEDANISIKSNDKGISSDNEVMIVGGIVNIDSLGESIGGKMVSIIGGKINLKSGDDAINSTDANQNKKDNQVGVYSKITGGELIIDAAMDGIDSNGDLYLDGGKIFINGSASDNERIIDYNGIVTCGNGLEMIGVGPGAKMQDLGDNPNQNYILVYFNNPLDGGEVMELKDDNDNVIISHQITKEFRAAIITSSKIDEGKSYTIVYGNKKIKTTIKSGKNEVFEK